MIYVWLGVALAMGILEGATVNLVSIWFVGGALAAFLVALFGGAFWLQVVLFFAVSVALLLLFRKTLWKASKTKFTPTNADRYLGKIAVVTENIDNIQGTGAVKIGGMEWTARSQSGENVPASTQVTVERIEGVTMYVANE